MDTFQNLLKKISKKFFTLRMRSRGYSAYSSNKIFEAGWNDLLHKDSLPLHKKIWAQKRGFLSDKIEIYELTEDNYHNYLSDFDYLKLHPINGRYGAWIDDKLTMKLILHPFSDYLPDFYFHFVNGEILRLMDCPKSFGEDLEGIILLLQEKGSLAAKPLAGTAGIGFFKFHFEGDNFFLNDQILSKDEIKSHLQALLKLQTSYLITEYLYPHKELARTWNKTANTVRIKILRGENRKPIVFRPVSRFGTTQSGVVDNSAAGGIFCALDPVDGSYKEGLTLEEKLTKYEYHPDSMVKLEGQVPYWSWMLDVIFQICEYLPQLTYMGFDLVVTDDGFKIIEINSLPSIEYGQAEEPIFKNEDTGPFFRRLLTDVSIN